MKLEEELNKYEKYTWPARLDSLCEELCFFQEKNIAYKNEKYDVEINDVQFEFGPYYKGGFEKLVSNYDNIDKIDDRSIGHLEKELNRLNVYVNSNQSKINDFGKAIESAINKILIESGVGTRISLPEGNISSYEAAIQILSDKRITDNIEIILEKIKKPGIFVDEIEKPIMVTRLWDHQSDALGKWLGNNCIGYVNMATATGKTVLGLSTIPALYGKLHPNDKDLEQNLTRENLDILIVAHNRLVLEQWKREFDYHLEIPHEITGLRDEKRIDEINFSWGRIEFKNYQDISEIKKNYDLVILDEVHRYPNKVREFEKKIENTNINILGLSGSIDISKRDRRSIERRLDNYLQKNVKTYTLDEAKKDSIIPDFDWNVFYTGYEYNSNNLKDSTSQCKNLFEKFSNSDDKNIPEFHSFDEVRNFSQTNEGRKVVEENLEFENFKNQLFTRRTTIWNQVPRIDAMEEVLKQYLNSKKCLVLVNSKNQVEEIENRLDEDTNIDNLKIWTITGERNAKEQRDVIDEFDQEGKPGVLIGTRNNLGVGVDIKQLEVVVNMSRGRLVNKSLIQNMGRMLRNPEGKKSPIFCHFVPIPTDESVRIPREDGKKILKGCSQYLAWGDKIDSLPTFSVVPDELEKDLRILEKEGIDFINKLVKMRKYSWPILGINKGDKKDAKTYLKEEILESDFPKEGSLIMNKFGVKEEKSESIEEEKEISSFELSKLKGMSLKIQDFEVIDDDGKQFFTVKLKGPLNWLMKSLQSQISSISESSDKIKKVDKEQEKIDKSEETEEVSKETKWYEREEEEEEGLDELFDEIEEDAEEKEERQVVELNLSSIKNSDIEVENIYLLSEEKESFYPLDDDGKPMSKSKLKEVDFSKIEDYKFEFRIPESHYELVIQTKYEDKRLDLGKLPREEENN
ncbi:MAG: DEAD/DEAH box helicase [archaeon]